MIKARCICKNYGSRPVLKNLSLEVDAGCFCMITGQSGCGKSTLLNVLSRLDSFDSGQLLVMDKDITTLTHSELSAMRRKDTGFIFQSYNLISSMTAVENVALPLKYAGQNYFYRRSRAVKELERMGLGDKIHHRPNQLSGGQQQRVAVARALITHPKVLFCDEPTGNLDPESSAMVMNGILKLKKNGSAIIMITHDHSLLEYADISYRMENGTLKMI